MQFGGSGNSVIVNLKVQILVNSVLSEDFVGGEQFFEVLCYVVQCYKSVGNGGGNIFGIDVDVVLNLIVGLMIFKFVSIIIVVFIMINFGNFIMIVQIVVVLVKSMSMFNVVVVIFNNGKFV